MLETILNAYRHRELILSFAVRDIKARYKQTALGVAWSLLQPLSMMLVFTLVFSLFAKDVKSCLRTIYTFSDAGAPLARGALREL